MWPPTATYMSATLAYSPARIGLDLNDFDETVVGPWELDPKRLTASINVAARENGMNTREREAAVMQGVAGYQENMMRLETIGTLDTWCLPSYPGEANVMRKCPPKALAVTRRVTALALKTENHTLLNKASRARPPRTS